MEIYDTLQRRIVPLDPTTEGQVGIYVCGSTVQGRPHLGHGRAAVAFDVLVRALRWFGYEVTHVRNITDIDDKIIAAAADEAVEIDVVAARSQAAFAKAHRLLAVADPTIEPRATEHVPEMIDLIDELISAGHAYEAEGDVYFAVRSYADYGALSRHNPDDLLVGARVEPGEHKHDPLDFALWKAAKPGEPSWPSPWGGGRPGWHIECSVMARAYLGIGFDIHGGGADIHGGGQDLIFPHHENEIAQSTAATGEPFARHWVHNGLVNLSGEKMSKSTGHVVDLLEALERWHPIAVRLFYLRTHYRKPLDFTPEALADAEASVRRLWTFRRRHTGPVAADPHAEALALFAEALNDDLDVAGALGVLFDAVRAGNKLLDAGQDAGPQVAAYDEMVRVLGIGESAAPDVALPAEIAALAARFGAAEPTVESLLERRDAARTDKDWATSDAIRDNLEGIGIVVEDTANGARWHRR